jgi:hypothetical protein
MVYMLSSLRPQGADLQKLVLLDYAIVYSGDLGGPPSLHTPVPYRGGELMSRRSLIEQGLYLMSTRGLVVANASDDGITYYGGPLSLSLVGSLSSTYLDELAQRCDWAASRFGAIQSSALTTSFSESGHLWGAELESMREGVLF